MKNNILISSILISLLFSIVVVSASVSSVTTSSSATSATTGTNVVITASITATSSESASVSIITSPSGITVSDPSGGQYQSVSLSTSPTSKTFTIAAGAPNTYSYYVTSGGTPSTTDTIIFVNPSTLTVTGSPSSTTKASSESFTESITISNPSSSAVTTSYTLSCPSASLTCTGDPTSSSGTTISAGSSTTLSWTVIVGGTSSSSTITFSLGDTSNAFSTSVSCSNCATTTTTTVTTTTGGATTPGVKVFLQKGKATITVPSIAAAKSATVDINKTEDVAFRKIIISVANAVNNIQITVNKLDAKPASVTQEISGKVFHYIQVDKNVSDTAVNQTIIRFEVNNTWINENNVNKSNIALFRYTDKWSKLQTSEISDDGKSVLYEAISPGLSVFAIAAETPAAPTSTPTVEETPTEEKEEVSPAAAKGRAGLWTIIIIVVIVAGVIFFLVKKNVIKLGKMSLAKRSGWDELKKKYSKR